MISLIIDNHDFHYELENLCRVFYPNEKICTVYKQTEEGTTIVYTGRMQEEEQELLTVRVKEEGQIKEKSCRISSFQPDLEEECERALAVLLYDILVEITGIHPSWGILTGVRPIKLMRRLMESEGGEEGARNYFQDRLLVSPQKTQLAITTMKAEQKLLSLSRPDSYSLYVSIPFCPTRCAYCSFVSQSVEKAKRLIPEYVTLLCQELEETARIARDIGLRLETVYIGGGTPTTLSPDQLHQVLQTIHRSFDLSHCREFTVEAGRPDTITRERLAALKGFGVDRISINPQTFNDHVLQVIGRKHTTEQTRTAFSLAREMGFSHINMDLIAGLPEDHYDSFCQTLEQVCALHPESITIHTLSMKKSSQLTCQGRKLYREECQETADMLEFAGKVLPQKEYFPYYLYRQSRMVGNLENVGWAKAGYEGLYNVYVMDETHTILACGAGAVTKLKEPGGEYLQRVFNFKYPYEYNSRFAEMLERKKAISAFYQQFGQVPLCQK